MATKPLTHTTGRPRKPLPRRLRQGTGQVTINGCPFDVYFPTAAAAPSFPEPLRVAEAVEERIDASIHGGGVTGQAGACARRSPCSLAQVDPDKWIILKKAGLLTRVLWKKESKKTASSRPARRSSRRSADPDGSGVKFGTDGVRGRANSESTASFALDLGCGSACSVPRRPSSAATVAAPSTPMLRRVVHRRSVKLPDEQEQRIEQVLGALTAVNGEPGVILHGRRGVGYVEHLLSVLDE